VLLISTKQGEVVIKRKPRKGKQTARDSFDYKMTQKDDSRWSGAHKWSIFQELEKG